VRLAGGLIPRFFWHQVSQTSLGEPHNSKTEERNVCVYCFAEKPTRRRLFTSTAARCPWVLESAPILAQVEAGGLQMKLTDGEKLIILMLADMYKAMKVKGEFDPEFISKTIYHDQLWGFNWEFTGIPFEKYETPVEVTQTVEILDWPAPGFVDTRLS
jgi:hypothetical protein